ncbi:hypothetical protein O181_040241 [Austropuccinia psidii MF-1]|uniref:CCHC-type domain-containing protein n=1 Tax=Austropuccinia psidii MF-1 TaxID=1389203 RepID=A0A9Q3DHF2_9BASI|nr:hypothetical protein [Austropuccinia psidii MF-1]
MPGELEHAIKCRCNQSCTLDESDNTSQHMRKRKNQGKYSPYKSSSFGEEQPLRVDIRDKPKERMAEANKKKNSCQNCGSTDHYVNNCQKARKTVYTIEKVPEDSESDPRVMPSEYTLMMTKTQKRIF